MVANGSRTTVVCVVLFGYALIKWTYFEKSIKQKNKSMSNVTVNHKIQYGIVFGTGKRLLCPYSSQNTVIIQPTINFPFITTHWKRFCKQDYNLCKYSFLFLQNTSCRWMPVRRCSALLASPWIHLQYLIHWSADQIQ